MAKSHVGHILIGLSLLGRNAFRRSNVSFTLDSTSPSAATITVNA
jgi:hypothetical protein